MRAATVLVTVLAAQLLSACGNNAAPMATASPERAKIAAPAPTPAANELSMRIDGVEWHADHDIFGAFHPPGYERALIVAGGRGPQGAEEQIFNLNLFGIDGPGRYQISNGDVAGSVAQLLNYTTERFIAGSMMGYDVSVDVRVAEAAPTHIDVAFSGALTGNDGVVMKIEDGRFVFRE